MATTIGVAVAVPDPWGKQLQEYRAGLGDESAEGIPTHITLMPPIEVEPDQVAYIERHLAEAAERNPAFTIHLRGTGTFRPVSPVVFVVVVEGISACEQLAFSIRRGPLATDLQFPYHPHVTIAQELDDDCLDKAFDELASFECRFTVDHFSLYVHEHPAGWRPTRGFELEPAPSQVHVPPRSG
ncbi:MAG TPA: 2'-5' RNA ligase family protein [Nocardioidaceae bacterium]|jgi:2'-5' RNA ligase|nr:2'-5' RNA ligase family protein [Nocardioidaceae bacterium]